MKYPFGGGAARAVPYGLILPGLVLYLVFALGPSLATVVYSLTDTNGLTPEPLNFIGLDNYQEFLFRGAAARQNLAALLRTLAVLRARHGRPVRARPARGRPAQPAAPRDPLVPRLVLPAGHPRRHDPGPHLAAVPLSARRPGRLAARARSARSPSSWAAARRRHSCGSPSCRSGRTWGSRWSSSWPGLQTDPRRAPSRRPGSTGRAVGRTSGTCHLAAAHARRPRPT